MTGVNATFPGKTYCRIDGEDMAEMNSLIKGKEMSG